jgi:hypothetical protein
MYIVEANGPGRLIINLFIINNFDISPHKRSNIVADRRNFFTMDLSARSVP